MHIFYMSLLFFFIIDINSVFGCESNCVDESFCGDELSHIDFSKLNGGGSTTGPRHALNLSNRNISSIAPNGPNCFLEVYPAIEEEEDYYHDPSYANISKTHAILSTITIL